MKVLVADKFEKSGLDGMSALGCEVLYEPDAKDEKLVERIGTSAAEVLVVRAAAGYNTIDVEAASERGIYVANCPGKNSIAVAELAFGLILALDRRIPENADDLRRGVWNKKEYSRAKGLFGKTLGLLGTGGIGREMVTRARSFGMPVVAWSRSLTLEAARVLGVERRDSPLAVAADSDVVSVHVALKPETRGMLGADFFAAMRPGAFFVNTSRAEVADQAALERAVVEKQIRAGLDVFAEEPAGGSGSVDAPIFRLPGVIGTHHIGASTDQAQEAIAAETVRIVQVYGATGRAPNVVNLARKSPATHLLVVRHFDRIGVLAAVFYALKEAGINVQETENIVFDGAQAAVARIHLNQAPTPEVLNRIRQSNADIIEIALLEI